jgi:hypothetical protein
MSLPEAKQTWLLWRLAIVKATLYSLVMLATCWLTALNKLDWSALAWDDRRNIIVGIFASWGTAMLSFLDKSAHQIQSGQIPGIENGDSKPSV